MNDKYISDYYERGQELGLSGYTAYGWKPDLTLPLAHELVMQLGIKRADRILDFGCAKGYLVKALRLMHYNAYGVDISAYAIGAAPEDVKPYVNVFEQPIHGFYDWIIAKDVLEHVEHKELVHLLQMLRSAARNMFVIVPLGDGEKYVIEEYEHDVTHVIRESLEWWSNTFKTSGFFVRHACYHMPHIKENWAQHEKGNGFFVLG